MGAIWTKIKADITSRTLTSTLIVITVVAASMLLTLALATLMNISAPYDASFQELHGAHLWLYFDREQVRSRDVERVEALDAVIESTGLQHSVNSRVRIGDTRVWVSLRIVPLEQPDVNRLLVQEGRYLVPDQFEVLAAKDLEDLYALDTGDTIEVTRWDGKTVGLAVTGLAFNPMWDTYRSSQPPYLYVTEETMRKLYPDEDTWDWSMGVRLADPEAVDEALAQIEAVLRRDALVGHTDWRDVKRSAIFGAKLNFVFLGAFSLFAVLATVLVITSSISTTVLAQFRQIGMLKAIGFTQNQILALYVGQYLVLGAIGSPLGLALGVLLSPLPLQSVAASLSTTFKPPTNLLLIALVLTAIPGFVILATLSSAYRAARANIIKAIAVGAEAPRKKLAWPVRLATRLGLPTTFILGLNDVFAKPFRSFLTGLNLTLGVIGIVFGLTLNETLDNYRADPSLLGIVYDAHVTRDRTSDAKTQRTLRRAPGVSAIYGEYLLEAETLDGRAFQVRAVEGDLEAFPFRFSQGRTFEPHTYEVAAGRGLLDWLGLEVGDELTLVLGEEKDRPTTWHIVGQYPEPVNAGQMLMASLPTVKRTVRHAEPRTYYLRLEPNADTARLRRYLEPRPDADLNLTLVGQAIPSVVVYLQLAILGLAAILIGIALINVFNTSLMAMQEKLRTIGVLKTVGMTPAQVMLMINTTAGLLGLLASGVGIPLGRFLTRSTLLTLSRTYGFGKVEVTLGLVYVLLLPPLMVGISMLGSSIPGRHAARLVIVDVLRSE
jgi:putative ABC transport system permease protein